MANCYFAKPHGMHCYIPFFMLLISNALLILARDGWPLPLVLEAADSKNSTDPCLRRRLAIFCHWIAKSKWKLQ